jgi:hypothetical protein
MTKKELIAQLDEINGMVDSIQGDLKGITNELFDKVTELKEVYKLLNELPGVPSEIEDDDLDPDD